MKWKIDFPNTAGVLAYCLRSGDDKLTVYYDPCGRRHRFLHQRMKQIGTHTHKYIDVRDTVNYPAEGWLTSTEARAAAEHYLAEYTQRKREYA